MILLLNYPDVIGIGASVFTGTSLLPQLFKIIRDKKAGDISIVMLIVLFTGLGLWTYYGFLREDLIIIISNGFSMIVNGIILVLTMVYRKHS